MRLKDFRDWLFVNTDTSNRERVLSRLDVEQRIKAEKILAQPEIAQDTEAYYNMLYPEIAQEDVSGAINVFNIAQHMENRGSHPFNVGQKVTYTPPGRHGRLQRFSQQGIVKSLSDDNDYVFVVYNCAGDWDRYTNYTAAKTKIVDLVSGWTRYEHEVNADGHVNNDPSHFNLAQDFANHSDSHSDHSFTQSRPENPQVQRDNPAIPSLDTESLLIPVPKRKIRFNTGK